MGFRHVNNVFFRWRFAMRQRKVQGFLRKNRKNLAHEQRKTALKALACKGFCVVQYTLCKMKDRTLIGCGQTQN